MDTAKQTVAVVDDDDNVRRALCRLLRSLSYRALDYDSGDAFLAAADGADLICALIDLHMPRINGVDVLDRLRSAGHVTPVVIITGADEASNRQACMEAGAFGFMLKPIERETLERVIRAIISENQQSGR